MLSGENGRTWCGTGVGRSRACRTGERNGKNKPIKTKVNSPSIKPQARERIPSGFGTRRAKPRHDESQGIKNGFGKIKMNFKCLQVHAPEPFRRIRRISGGRNELDALQTENKCHALVTGTCHHARACPRARAARGARADVPLLRHALDELCARRGVPAGGGYVRHSLLRMGRRSRARA